MNASSPEQAAVIEEIIDAVRAVSYWRAGVLMEIFVRDADLAGLIALRTSLSEEAAAVGWPSK
ncbi:hypothetical protein ACWGII_06735 [Streptomyces sp. NPDC054855]